MKTELYSLTETDTKADFHKNEQEQVTKMDQILRLKVIRRFIIELCACLCANT